MTLQQYKSGAYPCTNWSCTARLSRQAVRIGGGGSFTLPIYGYITKITYLHPLGNSSTSLSLSLSCYLSLFFLSFFLFSLSHYIYIYITPHGKPVGSLASHNSEATSYMAGHKMLEACLHQTSCQLIQVSSRLCFLSACWLETCQAAPRRSGQVKKHQPKRVTYHSFQNHYIINSKPINLCNCNCKK